MTGTYCQKAGQGETDGSVTAPTHVALKAPWDHSLRGKCMAGWWGNPWVWNFLLSACVGTHRFFKILPSTIFLPLIPFIFYHRILHSFVSHDSASYKGRIKSISFLLKEETCGFVHILFYRQSVWQRTGVKKDFSFN